MLKIAMNDNMIFEEEMTLYNTSSFGFKNTTMSLGIMGVRILVTDEVLSYFLLINDWGPGQCVAILGLILNCLNIITFVRQGLGDSVNISLLGLAVSDLGSLVFHVLTNLCWTPPILKLDLPFYPQQIMLFFFWLHVLFTRVTTGTTAWIAFERCLCIIVPLKVKSIVTPRRAVIYISMLYFIMAAAVAPMFYTSRFTWIFDSVRNKSVLGLVKIPNRGNIEGVAYLANNILPTTFFIIVVVCTIVLVKQLQRNSKWRRQTASSTKANTISNRDTKVVKMVMIISIVFIACYAPATVFFILILLNPDIKIDGKQRNFMFAVMSLLLQLEGINAGVNFFIYLSMSSKFRATVQGLFGCIKKEEKIEISKTNLK